MASFEPEVIGKPVSKLDSDVLSEMIRKCSILLTNTLGSDKQIGLKTCPQPTDTSLYETNSSL